MKLSFENMNISAKEQSIRNEINQIYVNITYELFRKYKQVDVVFSVNGDKPKGYILKQSEGASLNDLEGIFNGICDCYYNDGRIGVRCFDDNGLVDDYNFILADADKDGVKRFIHLKK